MATDKKPVVHEPVRVHEPKKETSGDKKFDEAIDRMLKKPFVITPSK